MIFEAKPKRPYKTFEDFRRRNLRERFPNLTYPCLTCDGYGKIVDPKEQIDPVEGYKHSKRITCPYCIKGEAPRKAYTERYSQIILDWKMRLEKWKARRKIQLSGFKKLTPDERQSLGLPRSTIKYQNRW